MKTMSFISNLAMPLIIVLIVIYGLKQKSDVFEDFMDGAKDGIKTTISIFPSLLGLFVAIGALRSSRSIGVYY